jgi:ComF family protein
VLHKWVTFSAGWAARLIAPPQCAACDAPLPDDRLFCAGCEVGEPLPPGRLGSGLPVIAAAAFEGAMAGAVRRFKYGSRPDLSRPLAFRVAVAVRAASLAGPLVLVPVPLHGRKLALRTYNQSALLAGELGRLLGYRVEARALTRVRDTRAQAELGRAERMTNVASAFAGRPLVRGARILLVDDVVTTGATALACASALTRAGAEVAGVAAVARGLRQGATEASMACTDAPGRY